MMKDKYWEGSEITTCNLCHDEIKEDFIDGATRMGPWAIMCPSCHWQYGWNIGQGVGQRYMKTSKGWLKVDG